MLTLIATIFIASILGSLHCVGMCGAFVAIAVGENRPGAGRHALLQSSYHAGRLITYVLLGLVAGTAGKLVDLGSTLSGLKPAAAALAGATMIAFGIVTLLRLYGLSLTALAPPRFLTRVLAVAHRSAIDRPPVIRAGLIGLFTTLLPCGWLYAFAAAAAGTASPGLGALTMAAFWLGTLPALVALGVGVRSALGPLGRRLPAITSVLLVAVGVYTLTGRSLLDPAAMASKARSVLAQPDAAPSCCEKP